MSIAGALLASLVALSAPAGQARQDQAFLGVFAETSIMRIAGMPALPDIELPEGITLPGQAGPMMMPGKPQRRLEVRLWSPGIAPQGATASLAIPAGLKLGPKLDLTLYRPKPEESKGEVDLAPGEGGTPPDFTIKRYWGSSPTVKPGQPEVTRWDGLTPEQKAAMRDQARKAESMRSYFYKPDWTTGYWPPEKKPGTIAKDAALAGHYALTTTYTGNVEIDVPDKVNFLAPLELSSPDLEEAPDLAKPIAFRWKAVPNVLGYHMMIIGMQGKNTLILWTSSEIKSDEGVQFDFMQMAEVAERVKSTAFMAPNRVDATVPAGIFRDCDIVFGTMIGYGPGAALAEGQPLPRVQTKTVLQMMLGGKQMKLDVDGAGE